MLEKRAELSPKDKQVKDLQINQNLFKLISERNPSSIHLFIPMNDEVDIVPTIMKLLANDITVVTSETLPKMELNHWVLESLEGLVEGRFNTRHPNSQIPWKESYDMIITPGLAFSEKGERIGYGGGYYDSFLEYHPEALKVGVCYQFQILEKLPQESFDVQMDKVISDIS